MEYVIKALDFGNGKKAYAPVFYDRKNDILTHFLSTEYRIFSKEIKKTIRRVKDGLWGSMDFTGNTCRLVVKEDITRIEPLNRRKPIADALDIDTEELLLLIDRWEMDLKDTINKEKAAV